MFVKLNERVYLNTDKITRVKIDEVQGEIRIRFYEGTMQVAKSGKFKSLSAATEWINENMSQS